MFKIESRVGDMSMLDALPHPTCPYAECRYIDLIMDTIRKDNIFLYLYMSKVIL